LKIDLHVHAKERSNCARIDEESQIRAAIQAGLDGLALTDHMKLVPTRRLVELNEKYAPFHIYTGIEVEADKEHWVVLGVHDLSLEIDGWHYPDLHQRVREKGGFIALAHPFRYVPHIRADLEKYPPDGIEISSFNTPTAHEAEIRALAARLGLVLLRNTDAHFAGQIGAYYNELPGAARDDQELLTILSGMKNDHSQHSSATC
jgi:histidinol phosphatase-like PHP family hydrolase